MENSGTKRDLENQLTPIRGAVRRLPEGVKKEQFSLLAAMIENGVSSHAIKQQLALMAG